MPKVKIRGQGSNKKQEPYPLNEFPPEIIQEIGKRIVHHLMVGNADMSGDQFDRIFSDSVSGTSYSRPLGIADVGWGDVCWSVKTVKQKNPHYIKSIRLISGRNSPTYSSDIQEPFKDVEETGRSVINIFNARLDLAKKEHDDVRLLVLIRNMKTREFTLFEREVNRYPANNFEWRVNSKNNWEAYEFGTRHTFTWQPHGSQFTILEPVPQSATRFRIGPEVPVIEPEDVLQWGGFSPGWIEYSD